MTPSWRPRLLPFSLLLVPTIALANGTPIARSDVAAVGNITPIGSQSIDLQQETLQIVIDGDWTTVRAEYQFVNSGPDATVAYGFPVDHDNPDACNDCDDVSDEEKQRVGKPLRDVRIEANGREVPTREIAEPAPAEGSPPQEFLRTWILTDLTFGAGERSTVTVSYRVRSWLNDWGWSTSFIPQYSTRKFRYLLSPSGNWGDGEVARLDISLDMARLTQFGGKLITVTPAGHTQRGDRLNWQLTDVDLRKLPDLTIEYDNSARLLSELITEQRLPATVVTQARASSTLVEPTGSGAHDISKALDGDPSTAWCEGAVGHGAGQTLTFDFRPGVVVEGVGILNGYTKNRAVYLGNGRITKVTAAIATREPTQTLSSTSHVAASLPERDFGQLNRNVLAPFIDWIVDAPPYRDTPKVTLTIDTAVPGAKYSDTCLSEIYFIGHYASSSAPP